MKVRGAAVWIRVGIVLVFLGSTSLASPGQAKDAAPWTLSWSDEFNAPDGTAPDPAKWSFDLGGGGWGNNERESYTARPENAVQRGGNLVITARQEAYTGADGKAQQYTSARMKTEGKFAQAYGRFEARMKLPTGKGIWPAFWMLGADIGQVDWPKAGEIDVLEAIGPGTTVYSTLHGPGYSGAHALSTKFELPGGEAIDAGFHVYAVEWAPEAIRFYFDDHLIVEQTPKDLPQGTAWVFDHPFFLLLDLAVGGRWPGDPDATTALPAQMLVDYVRVYRK